MKTKAKKVLRTNKIRDEMDLGADSEAVGVGEAVVAAVSGADAAAEAIGVAVGATMATETVIGVVVGTTTATETVIGVAAEVAEVSEAVAVAVEAVSTVESPGVDKTIMTETEDRGEATAIGEVGVVLGVVLIRKGLSISQRLLRIKRLLSTINDKIL